MSDTEPRDAERLAFSSALGFGDGVTEPAATLAEMVDPILEAFDAAHEHNECPLPCELCGERLADTVCPQCHGGGCLPNPQLAYLECDTCAGVGKIHEGCAEASYADLVAERDAARAELSRLRGVVEALSSALERTTANFRLAVQGKPVRDMAETLAEADAALASVPSSEETDTPSAEAARASLSPETVAAFYGPSSGETGERAEAFVELLPPDVGHNLRHFGPETRHVTGHECHCHPEQIPHGPASQEPTGADDEGREDGEDPRALAALLHEHAEALRVLLRKPAVARSLHRLADRVDALAARPVLSHEASWRRAFGVLKEHQEVANDAGVIECQCGAAFTGPDEMAGHQADHLAAVLDTQEAGE